MVLGLFFLFGFFLSGLFLSRFLLFLFCVGIKREKVLKEVLESLKGVLLRRGRLIIKHREQNQEVP